jgi:hypothetical protein
MNINKTIISQITGGIIFLVIFVFTFPHIGGPIERGLDPSYIYAFNYFFAHKVQIGNDIIFTHGPLGFLLYPQPVGQNLLRGILVVSIVYLILVFSLLYFILTTHKEKPFLHKALLLAFGVFLLNYITSYQSHFFPARIHVFGNLLIVLVSLLILNYETNRQIVFLILAAFFAAFALLVKANFGIIAVLLLFSYGLFKLIRDRNYKVPGIGLGALVACFFILWFVIYFSLGGIWNYLYSFFQFSSGAASAMTSDSSSIVAMQALPLVFLILIVVIVLLKERSLRLLGLMYALPFIAMFNYGFSRSDHIVIFAMFFVTFVFLLLIQTMPFAKVQVAFVAVCLSLLLCSMDFKSIPNISNSLFMDVVKRSSRFNGLSNLGDALSYPAYERDLADRSRVNLRDAILSKPLLDAIGEDSVDVYPWEVTYIAANDLNWKPRPIFQSYIVYTPWLDARNNEFFLSARAPKYLLWQSDIWARGSTASIDGRYLLNDEPKTISTILSWYEPVLSDSKIILFKRRAEAAFKKVDARESSEGKWGEWISVPHAPNVITKGRVHVSRTVWGKLKKHCYIERETFIDYKLQSGAVVTHRLVIDNAGSGIWAHPYVMDFKSIETLRNIDLPRDNDMVYYVDAFVNAPNRIIVDGWALIKSVDSINAEKYIVFLSKDESVAVKAETVKRQDITAYFKTLNYDDAGFHLSIPPTVLKKGSYRVGVLLKQKEVWAFADLELIAEIQYDSDNNNVFGGETVSEIRLRAVDTHSFTPRFSIDWEKYKTQ